MPRRLLLAAAILRDVARTVNAADRPLLEAAADDLTDRAEEMLATDGLSSDRARETPAVGRSIRALAAALDHPNTSRGELLVH